jgi:hypothetical protein
MGEEETEAHWTVGTVGGDKALLLNVLDATHSLMMVIWRGGGGGGGLLFFFFFPKQFLYWTKIP